MAKNKVRVEAYGWYYNKDGMVEISVYSGALCADFSLTAKEAKALRASLKEAIIAAQGEE